MHDFKGAARTYAEAVRQKGTGIKSMNFDFASQVCVRHTHLFSQHPLRLVPACPCLSPLLPALFPSPPLNARLSRDPMVTLLPSARSHHNHLGPGATHGLTLALFPRTQPGKPEMLTGMDVNEDAIAIINAEGQILLVSQGITTLFGYDKAELEGQNVSMLMPQPFSGRHNSYLQHYKETQVGGARPWDLFSHLHTSTLPHIHTSNLPPSIPPHLRRSAFSTWSKRWSA